MGLLSIFKRHGETPRATPTSESGDEVQRARTRARRRLIGAAVLLGIGIVGFPLVFETQPRPIPVNIPIEVPSREGAPPLAMPVARPAMPTGTTTPATTRAAAAPAPAAAPSRAATASPIITESREEAGRDVVSAASKPAAAASVVAQAKPAATPKPVESKPAAARTEARTEVKTESRTEAKPASHDAVRARALLEGKPDAADTGRFVVQVGAFADVAAARETRAKVEKLGLKTYTQVTTTASGKRIRVRAGPYKSRAEADKALAKARAAGLTAVVLTL